MSAIEQLAAYAVTKVGLQGVNWAALNAAGRGSVWDRDYITNYLLPAFGAATSVVGFLDLPLDDENKDTYQEMFSANDQLLGTIAGSVSTLGPATLPTLMLEVQLSRQAIRYLVSHVYQAASYGVALHNDETIHHSGKSDAEIASHANAICGMMNAIVLLDRLKVFSTLDMDFRTMAPQDQPASGLGVLPIAVIVAATVVAVAALSLLAWMYVSTKDVTQTNALVAAMCTNAQAAGDAATTQQCVNTLTAKSKAIGSLIPDTFNAAIKAVLPYALAGIGVYMLFLLAPTIIKSLVAKKTAAS